MRLQKIGLCLIILVLLAAADSASAATTYRARVDLSGQLLVTFRGDPAAGCAASFRCDVESGSIRWTPRSEGQLYLFKSGRGRKLLSGLNAYGFEGGGVGTLAILERRAADGAEHQCVDARESSFEALPVTLVNGRTLRFTVRPSGRAYPPQPPLPTHCGGPLPADMLQRMPTRDVSLRTLLRGPNTIDLSGSADFAAAGLAGTVESTIELTVAKLRKRVIRNRGHGRAGGGRGPRRPRIHFARVEYSVADLNGSAPIDVQADLRTCAPLDACGLAGSLTVTPGPAEGEAYLIAYGRMSKLELRRALGVVPGEPRRQPRMYGYVRLNKARGSVAADLTRDGSPACRDNVPLRGNALDLRVREGRVVASVRGGEGLGFDLLATRCPGPVAADLGGRTRLASGSVPLSAFARKHVTLRLDRGASLTTPGFRLRSRPDLTIELEREHD